VNLVEMVDAIIDDGGKGEEVVNTLIKYGHLPPDANTRPAGKTAAQVEQIESIRAKFQSMGGI
jgi:hypothetical protein